MTVDTAIFLLSHRLVWDHPKPCLGNKACLNLHSESEIKSAEFNLQFSPLTSVFTILISLSKLELVKSYRRERCVVVSFCLAIRCIMKHESSGYSWLGEF